MPSKAEGTSPSVRRKEKETGKNNETQTSTSVREIGKNPRRKIAMTGEVSSVSPDFTNLRKRQSDAPPPPSSFESLVSPPRRLRNSIAVSPKISSIACPGQAATIFRKKKERAKNSAPMSSAYSWESSLSPDDEKEGRKLKGTNSSSDDLHSEDSEVPEAAKGTEKVEVDENTEESNFQKRMQRSISAPPLINSPEIPSSGRGRNPENTSRSRSTSPFPFISPPVSRSASRSQSPAQSMPTAFFPSLSPRNGAGANFRGRQSIPPGPPTASPRAIRGRKSIAVPGGLSSVSGHDGPGAAFRKRDSMSPGSIAAPLSAGSLRGRRSVTVPGGWSSVSGHDDPGAMFRKRESMSPRSMVAPFSAGSLRGRRSVAVPGGLSSVSGHNGPGAKFRKRESMSPGSSAAPLSAGSLRGRRSVAVPGGISSVSSHDGSGAKFHRRESLSESHTSPLSLRGSAVPGDMFSLSAHGALLSAGSLRGRRSVAVPGALLSESSHDGRPLSAGSLRGMRSVALPGGLSSVSSHDGPGAKFRRRESMSPAPPSSFRQFAATPSPGSLRGRRSGAVPGGLSSRENSYSPSVSPERIKPKSTSAFASDSDHGAGMDESFGRRGSLCNASKGLATPPSSRKSFAVPGDLSSLSARGPSRTMSIAITGNMYSLSPHNGGGTSLNALVSPTQLERKGLGMINGKKIPSFASPRGQKMQGSKEWTSTYLNKPMGGPRGAVKKNDKSLSPSALGQISGSYLDKSPGDFNSHMSMSPGSLSRMSISKMAMVAPPNLDDTPEDISIQVTIPDIELKIRARKEQQRRALEYSVPEHIRKYREREERVRTAAEEKEYQQRELAIAYIYGWAARTRYKKLKRERDKKLAKIAKEKTIQELRSRSALKVQTRYRMYVKRKRYLHVMDCQRRRAKNTKRIKKIEKRLAKIPKETAAELKVLKKDHVKQKKELKREMKKLYVTDAVDDEDKMEQQNQNLIEYLREENKKLRDFSQSIQEDHSLLKKQFGLLEKKSAEIDKRFKSLKKFVVHKNETIQKTETVLQKCRHKYVPNHRKELANRNLHCATEMIIKEMYKKRLDRILDEVSTVARERELRKDAKRAAREVKRELAKIPVLETPTDLIELLEELDWTRKYS